MDRGNRHVLRWLAGLALLCSAAGLAGCPPPKDYRSMMQSADPVERAKGCKLAGDSGQKAAVPLLVDRLEDRDRAVRFYASWSLRMVTGKDFGWRESDPPERRAQAVAAWRQYARSVGGG